MLMAAAVAAPPSPKTQAKAAASLVEAGTSGDGQEELGPSGDKKRKSRKKKDPAAPKKALTAYLVFINGKRDQVIKEHPEADLKDQVGLQLLLCAFPSCLSFWPMVREKQPSRHRSKSSICTALHTRYPFIAWSAVTCQREYVLLSWCRCGY